MSISVLFEKTIWTYFSEKRCHNEMRKVSFIDATDCQSHSNLRLCSKHSKV